jgi:hypothetical protein
LATALASADDAVLAQGALVKAKTDNLPTDPADASDIASATGAILTAVGTVDTVVDAIKVTTDKLDGMLENTSDGWIWTIAALQNSGGSAPTADEIADEVQTRTIAAVTALGTGAVTASALATDAVNEIADGILDRDMSVGADSGTDTVRTVRQALRILRNAWTVDLGGVQTITKEDDSTPSWSQQLGTDANAEPVISTNPAGP